MWITFFKNIVDLMLAAVTDYWGAIGAKQNSSLNAIIPYLKILVLHVISMNFRKQSYVTTHNHM